VVTSHPSGRVSAVAGAGGLVLVLVPVLVLVLVLGATKQASTSQARPSRDTLRSPIRDGPFAFDVRGGHSRGAHATAAATTATAAATASVEALGCQAAQCVAGNPRMLLKLLA
jgi:hypothetical protein